MGTAIHHRPALPMPSPLTSDAVLVERVAHGDVPAFEAIYARYAERLFGYCYGILRNAHDGEEALQNTMLAAYRALSAGERLECGLRAWLYRVAHNRAIDVLRARQSRPWGELTGTEVQAGPDVHDRVETGLRLMDTAADLGELPSEQREALLLRELSGLSHREIGVVLKEDTAAVKRLIHQARAGLVGMAAGRDGDCGRVREQLLAGDRRVVRSRSLSAHLRSCAGCREFRAGLRRPTASLKALIPPLPLAVAVRVLDTIREGASLGGVAAGSGAAGAGIGAGAIVFAAGSGGTASLTGAIAVGVGLMGLVALPQVVTVDREPPGAIPATHTAGDAAIGSSDRDPIRGPRTTGAVPVGPDPSSRRATNPPSPPPVRSAAAVHPGSVSRPPAVPQNPAPPANRKTVTPPAPSDVRGTGAGTGSARAPERGRTKPVPAASATTPVTPPSQRRPQPPAGAAPPAAVPSRATAPKAAPPQPPQAVEAPAPVSPPAVEPALPSQPDPPGPSAEPRPAGPDPSGSVTTPAGAGGGPQG